MLLVAVFAKTLLTVWLAGLEVAVAAIGVGACLEELEPSSRMAATFSHLLETGVAATKSGCQQLKILPETGGALLESLLSNN